MITGSTLMSSHRCFFFVGTVCAIIWSLGTPIFSEEITITRPGGVTRDIVTIPISTSKVDSPFNRGGGGTERLYENVKLTPSDGRAWGYFGASVSIDGNTALIGARADDDSGEGSGAAYIFTRDAAGVWQQQAKLTALDAGEGDYFIGARH